VRINHDITQWQERQFDGCLHDFASTAALGPETDGCKLETKMGAAFKKNKHKDSVKKCKKQRGPKAPSLYRLRDA
jgi:hypothetical protein